MSSEKPAALKEIFDRTRMRFLADETEAVWPQFDAERFFTLATAGLDVIVDDRPSVSVGVRLTDAELIGAPWIVVVGRRLAEGFVEVRDRATGETRDVALADGDMVIKDKTVMAVGPEDQKLTSEIEGRFFIDDRTIYVRN